MLPSEIRKIYRETLKAFNSSLFVLTGVGIRAILETITKEKNIPGGNLNEKVDNLGGAAEVGNVQDAKKEYAQAIKEVQTTASDPPSNQIEKEQKGSRVNDTRRTVKSAEVQVGNRKGLLADKQIEILHKLRFMGNAAVHEVKPHTEHELDIALKIVEGLLQLLYIFPKQTEDLFSD